MREKNGPVIYGNVEVCLDQQWGSVCDTNWDKLDAQVVCAELGFFSKCKLVNEYECIHSVKMTNSTRKNY